MQRRIVLTNPLKEIDDLAGQLVRFLGSTLAWHKACQAAFFEGRLGLIERWSRETKCGCRLGNWTAFFLHTAKHLVLDLNQIPHIEELAGFEQLVGDIVWTRVECSLLAESLEFGIAGRLFGHSQVPSKEPIIVYI